MRLFVAIELPERVRTAVEDVTARLRSSLPRARWVRAGNLHLTLVFLGEVEESSLARFADALGSALAGHSPFRLQLTGSGCFPGSGRARVAWIGLADSREVLAVQAAVASAAQAAVGLEPERRPYRPHLTVARCAPPWPAAAGRRWSRAVPGALAEAFRVDSIALVRSRLGPAGPSYSNVHRFALGGAG